MVPQPPLLVPELVAGAIGETVALRDACLAACRELLAVSPEWIAVGVGSGSWLPRTARGSFRGFGVDVPSALSEGDGEEREIPLSALVTGWLRAQVGAAAARVRLVDAGSSPTDCLELGRSLVDEVDGETGLLVLGGGSNRHGLNSPGGHDDRAEAFDADVAEALRRADAAALLAVDPGLAADLGADGRAPWQVLAGFVEGSVWRGDLRYSAAPFGVACHVAVWDRA